MQAARRSLAGFVAVATVAVLVGGTFGSVAVAAKKKPLPKVTKAEASKIVQAAVRADIKTGTTNDVSLLPDFSTGLYAEIASALLEQSFAANEAAFDEYEVEVVDVFTIRSTSYPQQLLVQAEHQIQGGIVDRSVDLFVRESKKGDWLWDRSIAHPDDGWPEFALDKDGYVPAEAKLAKLSIDPATVPTELATYLSGQAPPANEALFDESIGTTDYRAEIADFAFTGWPEGFTGTFTAVPTEHELLVFPLKDGGALVSFGVKSTFHLTAGNSSPEYALDMTAAPTIDPRIPVGLYWDIVIEDLEAFSVVVPTTKSGAGLTAIPALYGPLSARGSTVANPSQYE